MMQSSAANEMIKKMKDSIEHQANNDAQQIKQQATNEAARLKIQTINQAKLKIASENELRKKQIVAQKQVKISIVNGGQRMKILKMRDDAMNTSMEMAIERLNKIVKSSEYPQLLHDLILQGLMQLREEFVEIAVTAADREVAAKQINSCADKYNKATGETTHLQLSSYELPPKAIGGCVLIAHDSKIQLSNTLMDRLSLACKDLYPEIRKIFD